MSRVTQDVSKGRLCNQMFRNIALSIMAYKHDLAIRSYASLQLMSRLGVPLYYGTRVYPRMVELSDEEYMSMYYADTIDCNVYLNNATFQTKQISNMIYDYLRQHASHIITKNKFNDYYNCDNVFIHVRLGDVIKYNPGVQYYHETLSYILQTHQIQNIYLSTDSPTHKTIQTLQQQFPQIKLIQFNEVDTLLFGSTATHLILSNGTFSAMLGYLAFHAQHIYYPETTFKWHGDIFSIPHWYKIKTY